MTSRNLPEADDAALAGTVNLADIETLGRSRLDRNALEYISSGANDEVTLHANREAFRRARLRPRVLVDVSDVSTRTTVLGVDLDLPVGIAPSAFHGLAHPSAELGTAGAAHAEGSLFALSTFSNTSIEDVARVVPGRFWFQLYVYRDREVSAALVRRAEAAGARALVVTVDAPYVGRREPNERHRFGLPPHLGVPNAASREALAALESSSGSQLVNYFQGLVDRRFTWRDVAWLRELTTLPIVLKGVLTAEDALLAVEHGCHV